ncbi:MAG: sugar phosphate isomerase/epimerase [Actinomycetota bacterium]|nr:sugar phosphate isomerase/epimerase [Actinomycetota bacterium]
MKISVFPKAYIAPIAIDRSMSVFEWIDLARSLPADGLEMHSGFFWDSTDAGVDRVGDAVRSAGFDMPMLCASPDFTHPDADQRAREFDLEVRMIEVTARLGGQGATCRVLSGQAHPGTSLEQGLTWAADAILRLIPIARELDVTLAIENHYKASTWQYPEFAQKKEVFLSLLDRIPDRTHFGVQFDPSNAIVAGEDSADFLATVIDRVVSMQASDRYLAPGADLESLRQADGTLGYSPALMHGVIGQGLNDYDRIFSILVGAGYDGWISIEDGVNGMDEMAASVEFLRAARETWFGGSTANRVRALERARAADA